MDYRDAMFGHDEPDQMWITGESALLLMEKLGEPPVDARGKPIDPKKGYYLSKETGLVPV
jgi:hypothetical protein